MKLNVLVIDDSRLARQELKHLLQDIDLVNISGEASNAGEAIEFINKAKPDLLFLDIQMPGKDGFELLEDLEETPEVIFTTAYNEYAIKAFEYNALDYLQKPLEKERLLTAIEKVYEKQSHKDFSSKSTELLREDSQVFVKDGDNCWFVKLADISLLEIEGSYTRIYFEENSPMIPKTLNYLETRLDPKAFFRANRQQMINLGCIDKIEPWFSGNIKILLHNGKEVEVSRRQTSKFKEMMSF